jgi:hypothetical protein
MMISLAIPGLQDVEKSFRIVDAVHPRHENEANSGQFS